MLLRVRGSHKEIEREKETATICVEHESDSSLSNINLT